MKKGKLGILVFLLAFAVFYGLDLANRGMERVQGQPEAKTAEAKASPDASAPKAVSLKPTSAAHTAVQVKESPAQAKAKEPVPEIVVRESFVNHLSNRIGDALRRGARALMGLVVSLFDSVTS